MDGSLNQSVKGDCFAFSECASVRGKVYQDDTVVKLVILTDNSEVQSSEGKQQSFGFENFFRIFYNLFGN